MHEEQLGTAITAATLKVRERLSRIQQNKLDKMIDMVSPEAFVGGLERMMFSVPVERPVRLAGMVDGFIDDLITVNMLQLLCDNLSKKGAKIFMARFVKPKSGWLIRKQVEIILKLNKKEARENDLYRPLATKEFKLKLSRTRSDIGDTFGTVCEIVKEAAERHHDTFKTSDGILTSNGNWAYSIQRLCINEEGLNDSMFDVPTKTRSSLDLNPKSISGAAADYVSNMKYNLNPKLNAALLTIANENTTLVDVLGEAAAKASKDSIIAGLEEYKRYGKKAFYTEFNMDFRGRIYQQGKIASVGSKAVRSLLRAGEKAALGKDGYQVILEAIAGSMGLDKKTWTERLAYSKDNLDRFISLGYQVQIDPVKTLKELIEMGADDVWMSMAYCLELSEIDSHVKAGGKVEDFMSDIFCNIDATCSAVQCMSLLSRNIDLAKSVNVVSDGRDGVNDVYLDAANEMVKTAATVEQTEAIKWFCGLEDKGRRALIKKVFMTDSYGAVKLTHIHNLTEIAIEKKLCEASKAKDYAKEVATLYYTMIDRTDAFRPLGQLKSFLGAVAKQHTKKETIVAWTMPGINGYEPQDMSFEYKKLKGKQVWSMSDGKKIRLGCYGLAAGFPSEREYEPDFKKPNTSTSPNTIHSTDGALLATIIDLMKGADLCLVHDSVGCRPDQMAEMKVAIKKAWNLVFIDNDILEAVRGEIELPACVSNVSRELIEGMDKASYSFC